MEKVVGLFFYVLCYWPILIVLLMISITLGARHRWNLGCEKRIEQEHRRRVSNGWPFGV